MDVQQDVSSGFNTGDTVAKSNIDNAVADSVMGDLDVDGAVRDPSEDGAMNDPKIKGAVSVPNSTISSAVSTSSIDGTVNDPIIDSAPYHATTDAAGFTSKWKKLFLKEVCPLDPFLVTSSGLGTLHPKQQLYWLLYDMILSHRWKQVGHVMCALSQEQNASITCMNVGSELMLHSRVSNDTITQMFRALMNCQMELRWEVAAKSVLHLIIQKDYESAMEIKYTTLMRTKKHHSDRQSYFRKLYNGYLGMAAFGAWAEAKIKQQNASSDSELLRWEAAITKYRVKAKMNLKPFLRDESNDWQIFVNMYIQLEEEEDKLEAAQLLVKQTELPGCTPQTYRKVYLKFKEWGEHRPKYLQKYIDLVPSDVLAMELCDITYTDGGHTSDVCAQVMFNYLDYTENRDDIAGWRHLVKYLNTLNLSERSPTRQKEHDWKKNYWDMRKSWWPPYHFNFLRDLACVLPTDRELLHVKCEAADIILGSDNAYSQQVQSTHIDDT